MGLRRAGVFNTRASTAQTHGDLVRELSVVLDEQDSHWSVEDEHCEAAKNDESCAHVSYRRDKNIRFGIITCTPTVPSTNCVTSTSHATDVSMYASSFESPFSVIRNSIA